MGGRIARHRAEINRFGLAGWLRRNVFWMLAHWFGLDVVRVALLPLQVASRRPSISLVLDHRLVERDTTLAAVAAQGLPLDPAVVVARYERGDLCLATFHAGVVIAYNWYSTGSTEISNDCAVWFPGTFVVSTTHLYIPRSVGRGWHSIPGGSAGSFSYRAVQPTS